MPFIDILDEEVIFELVQLAPDAPEGAVLCASFQRNVRDFLYPYPQLLPSYGAADREILLEKSWDFPVNNLILFPSLKCTPQLHTLPSK